MILKTLSTDLNELSQIDKIEVYEINNWGDSEGFFINVFEIEGFSSQIEAQVIANLLPPVLEACVHRYPIKRTGKTPKDWGYKVVSLIQIDDLEIKTINKAVSKLAPHLPNLKTISGTFWADVQIETLKTIAEVSK